MRPAAWREREQRPGGEPVKALRPRPRLGIDAPPSCRHRIESNASRAPPTADLQPSSGADGAVKASPSGPSAASRDAVDLTGSRGGASRWCAVLADMPAVVVKVARNPGF